MPSAKNLRVIVKAGRDERVNITLPIYSLNVIDSVVPSKVLNKLKEKNFDLAGKVSEIKAGGYQPQTIFETDNGERSYKVWIE